MIELTWAPPNIFVSRAHGKDQSELLCPPYVIQGRKFHMLQPVAKSRVPRLIQRIFMSNECLFDSPVPDGLES